MASLTCLNYLRGSSFMATHAPPSLQASSWMVLRDKMILQFIADKYFQKILNSNDCEKLLNINIMVKWKFEGSKHNPDRVVLTYCTSQNDANLECGKSAGPDGICDEYLKFSNG